MMNSERATSYTLHISGERGSTMEEGEVFYSAGREVSSLLTGLLLHLSQCQGGPDLQLFYVDYFEKFTRVTSLSHSERNRQASF